MATLRGIADDEFIILGQAITQGGATYPQDKLTGLPGLTQDAEVVIQRLHNQGLIGRTFTEVVGGGGPVHSLVHVNEKGKKAYEEAKPLKDAPPTPPEPGNAEND